MCVCIYREQWLSYFTVRVEQLIGDSVSQSFILFLFVIVFLIYGCFCSCCLLFPDPELTFPLRRMLLIRFSTFYDMFHCYDSRFKTLLEVKLTFFQLSQAWNSQKPKCLLNPDYVLFSVRGQIQVSSAMGDSLTLLTLFCLNLLIEICVNFNKQVWLVAMYSLHELFFFTIVKLSLISHLY